jgi:hypothetical protein
MGVLVQKADGSQQLLPLHVHDVLSGDTDSDMASDLLLRQNSSAPPSAPPHPSAAAVPHAPSEHEPSAAPATPAASAARPNRSTGNPPKQSVLFALV